METKDDCVKLSTAFRFLMTPTWKDVIGQLGLFELNMARMSAAGITKSVTLSRNVRPVMVFLMTVEATSDDPHEMITIWWFWVP